MKYIIGLIISTFAVLSLGTFVYAAPYNAEANNPQVVAFYATGTHGIPSEPGCNHIGMDIVMQAGNSGNFQEWSYGTQPCTNDPLHGDHDLWKLSTDGTCPANATIIHQPNIGDPNYPGWGTYLVPGATYCVLNNDFHPSK